jgi:hypothetical protein
MVRLLPLTKNSSNLFILFYYGFVHEVHKYTGYYVVQIKSIMSVISLDVKPLSGNTSKPSLKLIVSIRNAAEANVAVLYNLCAYA